MATARIPTQTWTASQGDLYIGRGVGFVATATLSGAFAKVGSKVTAAVKNITVTPPETSWEKQDFMGRDSNKFQNQLLDEKPTGTATMTATLVLGEDETIEDYTVSGTATGIASYTRYQIGDEGSEENKVDVCVSLLSEAGTEYAAFAFSEAKLTKWGDVRISGPDSHWEQDIAVLCLAKNFYWEFKD